MGDGGHDPLYTVSYASDSGVAIICPRGQSERAKRQSGRGCGTGCPPPPPPHGMEIFDNACIKRNLCTLNAIIKGRFL